QPAPHPPPHTPRNNKGAVAPAEREPHDDRGKRERKNARDCAREDEAARHERAAVREERRPQAVEAGGGEDAVRIPDDTPERGAGEERQRGRGRPGLQVIYDDIPWIGRSTSSRPARERKRPQRRAPAWPRSTSASSPFIPIWSSSDRSSGASRKRRRSPSLGTCSSTTTVATRGPPVPSRSWSA